MSNAANASEASEPFGKVRPVCILLGGPIYTIDGVRFEWSERFSPAVVGKSGNILDKQPGERARFWKSVGYWRDQGERVTGDGVCIYETPPEPVFVRLAGRNFAEVPPGADPEEVRKRWLRKIAPPPLVS